MGIKYIVYVKTMSGDGLKLRSFNTYGEAVGYSIDHHTDFGEHKNNHKEAQIGDTFVEIAENM